MLPGSGPCGTTVTLSGAGGFGNVQSKIFTDGYHGVHHVVDFWSLGGEYTVTQNSIVSWSDTSVVLRIWNFLKIKSIRAHLTGGVLGYSFATLSRISGFLAPALLVAMTSPP